jgi:uncharacterized protein (TIGR02147 family)
VKKTIYEYMDYKTYLNDAIVARPNEGRGFKAKMAEAASCQTAYISQVFNGNAQLSLEQGDAIARLLGLGRSESSFFFLLIQYARAGTVSLREHLENQILDLRRKMLNPRKKPGGPSEFLSPQEQLVYYSNWEYNAIHVLLSLPRLRTREALAEHLNLPLTKITELLEFLVASGLAARERGEYRVGTRLIHLDRESPVIPRHHSNWRFRAIQSLDSSPRESLHYSSVMAISRADAEKLQAMIREFIASTKPLIRESKEEVAQALLIDLFAV